jgi:hypothetical protein
MPWGEGANRDAVRPRAATRERLVHSLAHLGYFIACLAWIVLRRFDRRNRACVVGPCRPHASGGSFRSADATNRNPGHGLRRVNARSAYQDSRLGSPLDASYASPGPLPWRPLRT